MTISERIFYLLKSQNKTQKSLANYLDVREQTISDWKKGKTESYKNHIAKIAEFFNVSSSYLLGEELRSTAEITDDDIKFALFDGADGITDEMYAEVKQFAAMVKLREYAKKEGKK